MTSRVDTLFREYQEICAARSTLYHRIEFHVAATESLSAEETEALNRKIRQYREDKHWLGSLLDRLDRK